MKGLRRIADLVARLGPTDEQLMARVRAQDDFAAFDTLVRRWRTPVHQLCARMLGDIALGEDATQLAFTRIFENRANYAPTARFSTYLWRVAINQCHDELRRRERRQQWLSARDEADPPARTGIDPDSGGFPDAPSPQPGPDDAALQREEGSLVRGALQRLSPPLRAVLVLRHYHDLRLREIAEVLEIPEGTVNSRMAEALNQLARELKPLFEPSRHPVAPRSLRIARSDALTP